MRFNLFVERRCKRALSSAMLETPAFQGSVQSAMLMCFLESRKSWGVDLVSVWPQNSIVAGGKMRCSCTDVPCVKDLPSFLLYQQHPQALHLHFGYKSCKHKDSCGNVRFFFLGQGQVVGHLCAEAKWFEFSLDIEAVEVHQQVVVGGDVQLLWAELNPSHRKHPGALWDLWFYSVSPHLLQL